MEEKRFVKKFSEGDIWIINLDSSYTTPVLATSEGIDLERRNPTPKFIQQRKPEIENHLSIKPSEKNGLKECRKESLFQASNIRTGFTYAVNTGYFHMEPNINKKNWVIRTVKRSLKKVSSELFFHKYLRQPKLNKGYYSNSKSLSPSHLIPIFKNGEQMSNLVGLTRYKTFGGYNGSVRYTFKFDIIDLKSRKILKTVKPDYSCRFYTDNYLNYGKRSGDMMRKERMIYERLRFRIDIDGNGLPLLKMFENKRTNFMNMQIPTTYQKWKGDCNGMLMDSFSHFGSEKSEQFLNNISSVKHIKLLESYKNHTAILFKKKSCSRIFVFENLENGNYGKILYEVEKQYLKSRPLLMSFIDENILLMFSLSLITVFNIVNEKIIEYSVDFVVQDDETLMKGGFVRGCKVVSSFSRSLKKISFMLGNRYEGVLQLNGIYNDLHMITDKK